MAFSLARFSDLPYGRARKAGSALADDAHCFAAELPAKDPLGAFADLTY